MSIAKYIDSSRAARDKAVERLRQKITDNPYPDAYKEALGYGDDSIFIKIFGPDGRIAKWEMNAESSAMNLDKELYNQLNNGAKALVKLPVIKKLSSITGIDIRKQLDGEFQAYLDGFVEFNNSHDDKRFKLADLLYSDKFMESYDRWVEGKSNSDIPTGDTDPIIRAAFQEIYKELGPDNKEITKAVASEVKGSGNEEVKSDDIPENPHETIGEDPLNDSGKSGKKNKIRSHEDQLLEMAINDEKESKAKRNAAMAASETAAGITSTNPELPKVSEEDDIPENPYEQTNSGAETKSNIEASSPEILETKPNIEASSPEIIETKSPELSTGSADTDPINEKKDKAAEKKAKIKADMDKMLKTQSLNEMLASIDHSINTFNNSTVNNSETLSKFASGNNSSSTNVTNSTNDGDSQSDSSINSTESNSKANNKNDMSSVLNNTFDFKADGNAAIEEMKKFSGVSDADIAKAQEKIKANKLSKQSKTSELPTKSSGTEVSKKTPALPAANTNMTTEKEATNNNTSSKETMKIKEVGATPSTSTESKKEASQDTPAQVVNVDLSQLDIRLSRIEYALSNTLEVKIVE